MGFCYFLDNQFDVAEPHLPRATVLNPNEGHAAAHLGLLYARSGLVEAGLKWTDVALRLNPFHPERYRFYRVEAFYAARRYDEAADILHSISLDVFWTNVVGAACCAIAGRMDEAKAYVIEVMRLKPNFSAVAYASHEAFKHVADRQHFLSGMTAAGLPD